MKKHLIQSAIELHRQGKLDQAEPYYLKVLQADKANFEALNLLGVLRAQQGRGAESIQLLAAALKIRPKDFGTLTNYASALLASGHYGEALECYDKIVIMKPDFGDAIYNRGVALAHLKRFEEALKCFDKVILLNPKSVEAHYNRGVALADLNHAEDAIISFDNALALDPGSIQALDNRGNALHALSRFEDALTSYDKALSLAPQDIGVLYNRGATLSSLNRFEEALSNYDKALALRPSDCRLLNSRGVALWKLNRPLEALASYDRVLVVDPTYLPTLLNRGFYMQQMNRLSEALSNYDAALAIDNDNALTWNYRGSVLYALGRSDDALLNFDKAIALNPDFSDALSNRAHVRWTEKGQIGYAIEDMERAIMAAPDNPYAYGELFHMRMHCADWRNFEKEKTRIDAGVRAGLRIVRPFVYQAISDAPADLQACSVIFAKDIVRTIPASLPRKIPSHKKIRIGYVSGEFREQATAYLMAGLYELHDKKKFEIIAIDNGVRSRSPMRDRLEASFEKFIPINSLSDQQAAERIRAEEIDILVNLNGYFGAPRMGVFSHRPAPIQVNYLGFPATLGAPYIDYILADRIVIPEDEREFYTEAVVFLPNCYQANDVRRTIADGATDRVANGLKEDTFVFCNFNQTYKLTPTIFSAWMRILKQTGNSVLWLLESIPEARDNLVREAQRHGVTWDRLIFAQPKPLKQHLERLKLADLFLDTLPYNAHTTASDALRVGLPLLTCRGSSFPGRVASSLLMALDMPELVTDTMEIYESVAIRLACDSQAMLSVKSRLSKNLPIGPLFDADLFRRHIETAYTAMWENYLKGTPPTSFAIAAE